MNDEEKQVYSTLRQENIEQYYSIFETFDETGDGSIDEEEIGLVM